MANIDSSYNLKSDIDRYKRVLGLGFRTSRFFTKVFFGKRSISTDFFQDILSSNQSSDMLATPYSLLEDKTTFLGLAFSAQIPGYTLDISEEEVMKHVKYPTGATKGALKLGYLNDQWDLSYQFWRNYTRRISDGRTLMYPDDYMCDIAIYVIAPHTYKPMKEFYFHRCTPKGPKDVDLSTASKKEIMNFDVEFEWQDFEIRSQTSPKTAADVAKVIARTALAIGDVATGMITSKIKEKISDSKVAEASGNVYNNQRKIVGS